jgi:hypothetical protein
MTLNFIGGGLGGVKLSTRSGAQSLAIDGAGNLWLPNLDRTSVTELNNLGVPLSPSTTTTSSGSFAPIALGGWYGTTSGIFGRPFQAAIDQSGNAWISDVNNCLVELTPNSNPTTPPAAGGPFTSVCPSGSTPQGVSVDGNNLVWVSGTTFVSAYNSTSGTVPAGFPVSGFVDLISFSGPDYAGNTWVIDAGDDKWEAYNGSGVQTATEPTGTLSGLGSYAAFGPVSVTLATPSALQLSIDEDGNEVIQPQNISGNIEANVATIAENSMQGPQGIAVDGNNLFYTANLGDISVPANVTVYTKNGSDVSPYATGYTGGSTLTSLSTPAALGIDQSGNVWVVNQGNGDPAVPGSLPIVGGDATLTEFVGLAAPANPVFSNAAKIGKTSGLTAAGAYAVKP